MPLGRWGRQRAEVRFRVNCPHCDNELKSVYRGLVVESYVSHPLVDREVDLDASDPALPPYQEESEDGSHGVSCVCPHCRGDVTDLLEG